MGKKSRFRRFYTDINLTSTQLQDAKKKYDGISRALHARFYNGQEFSVRIRKLIGSYGKQTHIRPARDVDMLFIMPERERATYTGNKSSGQAQLLDDIREILQNAYPDPPVGAYRRVVRIEFSDTKHNVEVLPGWRNEDGSFTIPNTERGGSWEPFDPYAEIQKIRASNLETRRTYVLIRMMKRWQKVQGAQLKSYKIEKAVLAFFATKGRVSGPYSDLVRDFFDHFNQSTRNNENLKSHLNSAYNIASNACEFERNQNIAEATREWRNLFGPEFPGAV